MIGAADAPGAAGVAAWVASRTPDAPAPIAARIADALAEPAIATAPRAEACLAAAESILARLLAERVTGTRSRDAAIELLTADALATYAFEAASDEPAALPALARGAIARLARLGADAGATR